MNVYVKVIRIGKGYFRQLFVLIVAKQLSVTDIKIRLILSGSDDSLFAFKFQYYEYCIV